MPIVSGPLPTVIYPKPAEQPPAQEPQPNAEVVQSQEQTRRIQESESFYRSIGYPQLAGKYAPFEIPEGMKVWSIRKRAEGLEVRFAPSEQVGVYTTEEFNAKQHVQQLEREQKATSAQKQTASQTFYTSIGYPQYGGKYEPFEIPEGSRVLSVHETSEGLETVFWPTAKAFGQASKSMVVASSSDASGWKDLARAAKNMTAVDVAAYNASLMFWTKMGFPQYGGRYAPVDVPAGAGFESVTETPEGLKVELKLPYTESVAKDVFVPTSLFGPKLLWVSETTGEHFEQITPSVTVKTMQGLTPSLHEQAAMLGISLVSAVALPLAIPKLAIFATVGVGVGEVAKYGVTGQYLTVEEIIGAASIGELIGLVAINLVMPKIQAKLQPKASEWLTERYKEGFSGGFAKEQFGFESEFGFQKGAEAIDIPTEQWAGLPERIVMKVTGARPYLAGGEISIPVVETVSKTGVISPALSKTGIPIGEAFTDVGWEMSVAPRMGGVFITKVPTATSARALDLFFGIGQELIPYNLIKAEGETLGFTKATVKAEPVEKGLPSSILEESYYPKVGFLDRSLEDVNVRGLMSWSKWPTIRELMSEQKLLPFVTQTQVTRLGITPFIPEMNLGIESTQFLGSAFMLGLGSSLLSKASHQTEETVALKAFQESFLLSRGNVQPKETVRLKAFQVSFIVPSLKNIQGVYSETRTEQEQVPALVLGLSLAQEMKQIQSLAQIQRQIQKQVQSLANQFKTPSLQRHITPFNLPSEAQAKMKGKKRAVKKRGEGLYLWEFPILDPEKVWKLK